MGRDPGSALSAIRRLRAQLLSGPAATDPLAVTARLLAVQAQDPRGARLAVRARMRAGTVTRFDRALGEERSLLITWLNRGTLHLVRSEDYAWIHALTTPPLFTGNARRLAQEGVPPAAADRAVAVIERSLGAEGPLTRAQLRDRIVAANVRTERQALVHLLMLACLRGVAVRGPMVGRHHAYALVDDWLGPQPRVDRDRALAELARRYLAGHGPADDRDLAKWAGLPLRDARAALAVIAREVRVCDGDQVELSGARHGGSLPPPRLLGPFEPVLLGWSSREFIVGEDLAKIVSGGVFRSFALVDGRAAAVWGIDDGKVWIEPFRDLPPGAGEALEHDGREVLRYLGL
jgi:hypothetical protein